MINKVSILTNNFNGSLYINNFFESLYEQSFQDWELIFFDNCSSDNSLDVLDQFKKKDNRIKLFKNENHTGLGIARSNAIKYCNNEYIAIWDIDDTSDKDRLYVQHDFLNNHKDITLVASNVIKNINGKKIEYKLNSSSNFIKSQLYWKNIIVHSSVMFRKNAAIKIGGYDPSYNYSQDYNFYIKLLINNYKISSIDKFLCFQNISNRGLSKNKNMKKIILRDQINNLISARKIQDVNLNIKILNQLSYMYYYLKLIID